MILKKIKFGTIDIVGQRFGKLVVLRKADTPRKWVCVCDCGTEKSFEGGNLRNGGTKSCGCLRDANTSERFKKEMAGMRFGRLLVLKRSDLKQGKHYLWKCICDCGKKKLIIGTNLKQGHTTSCGCLAQERDEVRRNDKWLSWVKSNSLFDFEDAEIIDKFLPIIEDEE